MAKPELSVVISALDEEKSVKNVLRRVLEVFDKHHIAGEIVFMDNHSQDRTGDLADQVAKKDKRVRIIHRRNRPNKDLGSSLMEGFKNARGKYFLIMDCDLSHSPNEIPNLLKHRNEADIIIGSRYVKGGKAEMSLKRTAISRSFNFLARFLLNVNAKDITTGFKLYNKKVIDNLKLENTGFGLHVEIFLKAMNKGYIAKEIPIFYRRADKKSTLNYRKQFKSYAYPVIHAFKDKYF